jgi:hypothetical protein
VFAAVCKTLNSCLDGRGAWSLTHQRVVERDALVRHPVARLRGRRSEGGGGGDGAGARGTPGNTTPAHPRIHFPGTVAPSQRSSIPGGLWVAHQRSCTAILHSNRLHPQPSTWASPVARVSIVPYPLPCPLARAHTRAHTHTHTHTHTHAHTHTHSCTYTQTHTHTHTYTHTSAHTTPHRAPAALTTTHLHGDHPLGTVGAIHPHTVLRHNPQLSEGLVKIERRRAVVGVRNEAKGGGVLSTRSVAARPFAVGVAGAVAAAPQQPLTAHLVFRSRRRHACQRRLVGRGANYVCLACRMFVRPDCAGGGAHRSDVRHALCCLPICHPLEITDISGSLRHSERVRSTISCCSWAQQRSQLALVWWW